jgi:enterochelin esterase-like enzyme
VKLDGLPLLLLGLLTVVGSAVALAGGWSAGGRWRPALRGGLVLASALSVSVTSFLQVNRMTEAYPTWSALAGATAGDRSAPEPAQPVAAGPVRTASRIVTVTVPGPASRLNLPMYVYLPRGYDTPAARRTRYPVVEALHGFPGSPRTWLRKMKLQSYLDTEIAAGRMPPTVVLLPYQTPRQLLDTECTNLAGGPQTDTFLTTDVPAFVRDRYRVRTDRAGWGLIGYSAGAFCATNLLLRHADRYAAGASLSGYSNPGIRVGDGSEVTTNNPAWRLRHLPQPPVSLFLGWAADDPTPRRESSLLRRLAHAPLAVTTAVVAHGGHSDAVWRQMVAPAFDWLAARLARPITEAATPRATP